MTIEHNNSYSFQGENYGWPGGTPGDKPFPTGAFSYVGIKRLGSGSFSSPPDYQAIHMCNAETGGNTYNLEVLIYGDGGPLDGKIIVGGYDQVIPQEDHDTGITGADRTKWICWIISCSGIAGEAARVRWQIKGDATWYEQPYDGPPKTNYARGDLAKVFSGYGAEQVIAMESADSWVFARDLSNAEASALLAEGGSCPASLTAYLDRHFPHATAANANDETVQSADGVPNGTAVDSANTPYPWVDSSAASLTGSGALAGTLSGTANASMAGAGSGTLNGTCTGLAGITSSCAGVGALSGALVGVGAMAATCAGTGTLSGTPSGLGSMVDGMAGTGSLAGTLSAVGSMTASCQGSGALSGTLSGLGSMTSAEQGTGTLNGTASATGAMVCSPSALGTLNGTLINGTGYTVMFEGDGTLSGTAVGLASVAASLAGTGTLSGVCSAAGALSCSAAATGTLAGTLSGLANATAPLTATGLLNGTLADGTARTIAFTASGALAGALVGRGEVAGAFTGSGSLSAVIQGLANIAVACTASGTLAANLDGLANAVCGLSAQGTLSGSGQAAANLTVSMAGTGALSCTLGGLGLMEAACLGGGSETGTLTGIGSLVANLLGMGVLDATANASTAQVEVGVLRIALVHSRGQCIIEEEQAMSKFYSDTDRTLHLVFTDRRGNPIDLSDLTIEFVWRYLPTGFRVQKSTGDGIEIQSQTGSGIGKAAIEIVRTDTRRVRQYTAAEYEIAVTDSEGRRDVWARGLIPIEPSYSYQ